MQTRLTIANLSLAHREVPHSRSEGLHVTSSLSLFHGNTTGPSQSWRLISLTLNPNPRCVVDVFAEAWRRLNSRQHAVKYRSLRS